MLTHIISQLQNVGSYSGKADMLNRYNQYLGDPGFLAKDMARYRQVTPEAVMQTANSILDSAKRAVVITVPKA